MGPLRQLCSALVADGVAPAAAAGWARRTSDGWDMSCDGATADDATAFFDLASLSKPMTALAVARVPGLRSAPVGAWIEEARGTAVASMPIEMLLAHRAGLEGHLPLYRTEPDPPAMLIAAARSRRPALEPSSAVPVEGYPPVYSDMGYLLVGEALARATGHPDAGAAVDALVVAPLGLGDVLGTARLLRQRVARFDRDVRPTEVVPERGGEVRGAVHDENAWAYARDAGCGHAGMFGTVDAVLRFGAAAHDAIVSGTGPLAIDEGAARSATREDFGWLVRARPGGTLRAGFDGKSDEGSSAGTRASASTFGHLGFTGTSLWIDPVVHAVVVLLTNRVHPTRENVRIREARPRVHDALLAMAAEASRVTPR